MCPSKTEPATDVLTIEVDMSNGPENAFESNCGRAAREQIRSGHGVSKTCTLQAWHTPSRIESGFRGVCGPWLKSLICPMIYVCWDGRHLDRTQRLQKIPWLQFWCLVDWRRSLSMLAESFYRFGDW